MDVMTSVGGGPPASGTAPWRIAQQWTASAGPVWSVAVATVEDRAVIVSGGRDGTVRRFDAATGEPLGEPVGAHTGWVRSVAVATVEDRAVIVSGGGDGGDDGRIVVCSPTATASERQRHRLRVTPRLATDVAADEDLLGVKPIADALVKFLENPQTRAPLSIAVKGPWGAGKSTLMGLVRQQLDPEGRDGRRATIPLTPSTESRFRSSLGRLLGRHTPAPRLTAGEVLRSAGQADLPQPAEREPERQPNDDDPSAGPSGPSEREAEGPASDPGGAEPEGTPTVRPERVTVWFNPWAYQTGEQVWAGLAHELIEQVSDRLSRYDRERFWLRLNLARVDRHAVRRTFYKVVFERVAKPLAGLAVVAAILAVVGATTLGVTVFAGGALVATAISTAVQWRQPASSLYHTQPLRRAASQLRRRGHPGDGGQKGRLDLDQPARRQALRKPVRLPQLPRRPEGPVADGQGRPYR